MHHRSYRRRILEHYNLSNRRYGYHRFWRSECSDGRFCTTRTTTEQVETYRSRDRRSDYQLWHHPSARSWEVRRVLRYMAVELLRSSNPSIRLVLGTSILLLSSSTSFWSAVQASVSRNGLPGYVIGCLYRVTEHRSTDTDVRYVPFHGRQCPILMGIVWTNNYKSSSAYVVAPLCVGLFVLILFALWETFGTSKHPLTPTYVFTSSKGRDLTAPAIALAIVNAFFYSTSLLWPTMIDNFWTSPSDSWEAAVPLAIIQGIANLGRFPSPVLFW